MALCRSSCPCQRCSLLLPGRSMQDKGRYLALGLRKGTGCVSGTFCGPEGCEEANLTSAGEDRVIRFCGGVLARWRELLRRGKKRTAEAERIPMRFDPVAVVAGVSPEALL